MVFNADEVKDGQGVGLAMTTEAKKHSRPDLILGVGAVAVLAYALGWDRERTLQLIEEVYPGSRHDDTCLAEIEVWGTAK